MLSLSNILKLNAVSSGATGLLLVFFSNTAAGIFGVSSTSPFMAVGLFLVLFAVYVFGASMGRPIKTGAVRAIIAMDTLWVIASIVLLAVAASTITLWGNILIAGVALWVALMAYLQNLGLKTMVKTAA